MSARWPISTLRNCAIDGPRLTHSGSAQSSPHHVTEKTTQLNVLVESWYPAISLQSVGGSAPEKRFKVNRLRNPYQICTVGRFGDKPPERDEFGFRPARRSAEVFARSPSLLGLPGAPKVSGECWSRKELAEGEELGSNVLRVARRSRARCREPFRMYASLGLRAARPRRRIGVELLGLDRVEQRPAHARMHWQMVGVLAEPEQILSRKETVKVSVSLLERTHCFFGRGLMIEP